MNINKKIVILFLIMLIGLSIFTVNSMVSAGPSIKSKGASQGLERAPGQLKKISESSTPISYCQELNVTGETYYLTGHIFHSENIACMTITEDDITLDCQNRIIDGAEWVRQSYHITGIKAGREVMPPWTINNITIKNCILRDWSDDIAFFGVFNSTISNVKIGLRETDILNMPTPSDSGISLLYSDSNTINNSRIENNGKGISLYSAGANKIYNNLFNNTMDFYFDGIIYQNYWNTTKTPGTNIIGGPFIGGNYWTNPTGNGHSDTCSDFNLDGFCDNYYELNSDGPTRDYLPLFDITLPPKIIILSPKNKIYYTTEIPLEIPLEFTINKPTSWIKYSLDNRPNKTITGNTTLVTTYESHNIVVYAEDTLGNMGSSEKVYFQVAPGGGGGGSPPMFHIPGTV